MICPRFQTVCALEACVEYGCVDGRGQVEALKTVPPPAAQDTLPEPPPRGPIDRAGYMLALIERLVTDFPHHYDRDAGFERCFFCNGATPKTDHADDCPWVEARKLIEATR